MTLRRYGWPLIALVPALIAPFVAGQYAAGVLATVAIDAIAALGLAITLQKTGQPSLAQASFMAIGAYGTGLLEINAHAALVPAAIGGVAIAAAAAYVVGAVLLELEGLYFALGTLAFVAALVAVLANAPWFGGAVGLDALARLNVGSSSTESSVALTAWIVLFAGLVLAVRIDDSRLGRGMRMVRESAKVARSVGMDPARVKRIAFTISGAYAGIAGALLTMLYGIVNPQLFSLATSITIVSMVIVGGEALWGSVIGAVVMVGFNEFSRAQLQFAPVSLIGGINLILNGAILLAIMRLWPGGISSLAGVLHRGHPAEPGERAARVALAGMGHQPPDRAAASGCALRASGISHRFGGVAAVSNIDLTVKPGEILAVIGPNGAGKTTLLSILGGFHPLQRGHIELRDESIGGLPANRRAQLGIAATFQHMEVVTRMSVEENVLANGTRRDIARSAIDAVGLRDNADSIVGALSFGQQRMVELARAIALPALPRVLLMDEPASGLSEHERALLAEVIRYFARAGTAVVLVEHDVAFVARLADRIMVLEYGVLIAQGPPQTVLRAPNVVEAYIGRTVVTR